MRTAVVLVAMLMLGACGGSGVDMHEDAVTGDAGADTGSDVTTDAVPKCPGVINSYSYCTTNLMRFYNCRVAKIGFVADCQGVDDRGVAMWCNSAPGWPLTPDKIEAACAEP